MAASSSSNFDLQLEEEEFSYGAESGCVEARTWCDHLGCLSSDLAHIPAPDTPCNRCLNPGENWLCLCCKDVLCSRFVNKHMLQHYNQTNHCLALGYSDLSVWCYNCNAYLDSQAILQLRPVYKTAYILKFSGARPFRTVDHPDVEDNQTKGISLGRSRVEAQTWCDHLGCLSSDLAHIPAPDTPCNRCLHPGENWLCLCCKDVLCSRFVNKHMLQHYNQTNHCLALGYSDLSVWCYNCDAYLDAQAILQLRPVYETAYILKFSGTPAFRTVDHPDVEDNQTKGISLGRSRVEARTWCDHLGCLSSDLAHIPAPDTPCNRNDCCPCLL